MKNLNYDIKVREGVTRNALNTKITTTAHKKRNRLNNCNLFLKNLAC